MTNYAIVGCGKIAARHAEQIRVVGILIAVCDIIPERAADLGNAFGARVYTDFDEMLNKEPGIEVVVVCTPNGLHAEHSIKSLQNGKHVLCEKPMCLSSPAGWSMRDTAHFFRRHLFVVKQNRFNPPVVQVKKLLDEGKLGRILSVQVNGFWNRTEAYYYKSWKGSRDLDGGILFTQFSHFIDLFLWFCGEIHDVRGSKGNLLLGNIIETEDNLACAGTLESGAVFSMHFSVNTWEKNMEGSITLVCEKGTIKIGGQYLNTLDYQSIQHENLSMPPLAKPANDYGHYQGSMSNHDQVYDQVNACLQGKSALYTGAEDGLRTVAAIEKIYKSCMTENTAG